MDVVGLIFGPNPPNFENQYNLWRCSNDAKQFFFSTGVKDQCGVFRPYLQLSLYFQYSLSCKGVSESLAFGLTLPKMNGGCLLVCQDLSYVDLTALSQTQERSVSNLYKSRAKKENLRRISIFAARLLVLFYYDAQFYVCWPRPQ